jgi:hypothetical protein
MASINQSLNAALPNTGAVEMQKVLAGMLADITAIRAEVVKLVTDMGTRIANHNTLIAKLNLDEGVTDTNYAAATAITAGNPADLATTA